MTLHRREQQLSPVSIESITMPVIRPAVDFPTDPHLDGLVNLFNPGWIWGRYQSEFGRQERTAETIRLRQFSHTAQHFYGSIETSAPRAVHVRAKIYRIASGSEAWLDYDRIMKIRSNGRLASDAMTSVVFESEFVVPRIALVIGETHLVVVGRRRILETPDPVLDGLESIWAVELKGSHSS